jgi:hypothetical protein
MIMINRTQRWGEKDDPHLYQHITSYVGGYQHRAPISFTLYNKRGKYGLRAIGTTSTGRKLRRFWRQATIPTPTTPPTAATTTTTTPMTKKSLFVLIV